MSPASPISLGLRRAILIATMLATVFAGLVSTIEPASAAAYRATANVNLRSGPGTSYDVVRLIPSGATVEVTGEGQNGFLPVIYSGSSGYASADYLTTGSDSGSGTASGPTGTRYVVDGRLNLRSGPGTSYGVTLVLQDGSAVQLTGEVSGSYSKVTYNGTTGWVATQYLSTSGGSSTPPPTQGGSGVAIGDVVTGSATTTVRLNLRRGPGTSYATILTMPNGASVEVMGTNQSGFLPVRYNGSKGWASAQFLSTGSTPAPTPPPGDGDTSIGDTVTGSATTTDRLNLRRGPGGSYGVILVMASGATIDVMGTAQNGYTPVRSNGTKGWAASAYLTTGGGTPNPGNGSGTVIDTKVTTANVNLRSGPGTSYSASVVVPSGTEVGVTGSAQNGFTPVKWGSRTGYISSTYLGEPGSTPPPSGNPGEQAIIDIIYAAADKWGQPRADMLRVARCESGLNPNAVNRSSGASGLFQFMPGTWAITPNGKRGESVFNATSAADATGWMWANGMRNHWVCQ